MKKRLKLLFDNSRELTPEERNKGRKRFVLENVSANVMANCVGGIVFTGILKYLGINDGFNGVLGSLGQIAGAAQVFAPLYIERLSSRKLIIILACFISRILQISMIFIPVFIPDMTSRLIALTTILLISGACGAFIGPAVANWFVSLVDEDNRGRFFSKRDAILNVTSAVTGFSISFMVDKFKEAHMEFYGYAIAAVIALIFTLLNVGLQLSIKEPKLKSSTVNMNIKDLFLIPLKDRVFRKLIILFVVYAFATCISGPFTNVYMISVLGLPLSFISLIQVLCLAVNVGALTVWGRLADRFGWISISKIAISLNSLYFILMFLTVKEIAYVMIPICSIIGSIFGPGIGLSFFNMQYAYSPEKGRTAYTGFICAVSGVVGFLTTLASGIFIGRLTGVTFNFYGIRVSSIQILFSVSAFMTFICVLFLSVVFTEKNKKFSNGVKQISE